MLKKKKLTWEANSSVCKALPSYTLFYIQPTSCPKQTYSENNPVNQRRDQEPKLILKKVFGVCLGRKGVIYIHTLIKLTALGRLAPPTGA